MVRKRDWLGFKHIIIDFWGEEMLYAIVLSIYAAFTWNNVLINLFSLSLEEGMVIIKDQRGCHFETTMGTEWWP